MSDLGFTKEHICEFCKMTGERPEESPGFELT